MTQMPRNVGLDSAGYRAAVVSYRLGVTDGVSVAAAQCAEGLRRLGLQVRTLAGEGSADVLLPGLALDSSRPPPAADLRVALDDADLVVVENVCSLPLNRAAGEALGTYLAGQPALLRHHDLPWERFAIGDTPGWPLDDPAWRHLSISEHARQALAVRGFEAVAIYPGFPPARPGRRATTRRALGIDTQRLVLQPTRAIARKNVPAGLALAEALDAVYWLTGPAEEGYTPELDALLRRARCPVRRYLPDGATIADAYAAADVVALPSTWEGFGLPLVESALHRKPLALHDYPVAREIAALGFRWFPVADPGPLCRFLAEPDRELLDANEALARAEFGMDAFTRRLGAVVDVLIPGALGAAADGCPPAPPLSR